MTEDEKPDTTDTYLDNNTAYIANRGMSTLPRYPSKHMAVVACMDSRLDIFSILGLGEGEAHIIRNAGGVVSDDVLRSLIISQRLLGTSEIILIHHTDCGMLTFKDEELGDAIAADVGYRPLFAFHAFPDLAKNVREGLARIRNTPFLPHHRVRGFIFDVSTGKLEEVL